MHSTTEYLRKQPLNLPPKIKLTIIWYVGLSVPWGLPVFILPQCLVGQRIERMGLEYGLLAVASVLAHL